MWLDNNCVHRGRKSAVSGGWMWLYFCKYVCKKSIWLLDQYLYGEILSKHKVMFDPTNKPDFFIQIIKHFLVKILAKLQGAIEL